MSDFRPTKTGTALAEYLLLVSDICRFPRSVCEHASCLATGAGADEPVIKALRKIAQLANRRWERKDTVMKLFRIARKVADSPARDTSGKPMFCIRDGKEVVCPR